MTNRQLALLLTAFIVILSAGSCKQLKLRKNRHTQSDAIYTTQPYSDYHIDSNFIHQQLEADTTLRSYADDIRDFYQRRGYGAAWLDQGTLTMSGYDFLNTLRSYQTEVGDSSLIAGLSDAEVGDMLLSGSSYGKAMLDLRLTATFFKYADREYNGTAGNLKDLEWYIPRMKKDYQRLLDSLVVSPATYTVYEPVNSYYKSLKKALIQYRAIEQKGGFAQITGASLPMHKGDSSQAVLLLKKQLSITGDYKDSDMTAAFTDTLAAAVAQYQHRMGLRETGRVDSLTLTELNTPIAARIRQIMLNMERLRWMPDSLPSYYILVNIPEYRLHMYDSNALAWSMDVVVGNTATATSIFTGRLSVVDFCPYWNVPTSIIKNELLPKLKKNPGYLTQANMEVLSKGKVINSASINWNKYTKGVPYVIRQKPGPQNSLGLVAFFFPNSFDIFLHDTPAKSFFNESSRAFSHGCIRLSDPPRLAAYLFRSDTTMTLDRIQELMNAKVEKKIAVRPSVPVYIGYFTTWVDANGQLNFRRDIYGLDAKLAREIFGK
jgi:murein L,D-transpeptidase YcbB/YkuD